MWQFSRVKGAIKGGGWRELKSRGISSGINYAQRSRAPQIRNFDGAGFAPTKNRDQEGSEPIKAGGWGMAQEAQGGAGEGRGSGSGREGGAGVGAGTRGGAAAGAWREGGAGRGSGWGCGGLREAVQNRAFLRTQDGGALSLLTRD